MDIHIGDISLGKVDGKEEFILYDGENKSFFDSYLIPENVSLERFRKREVYFITGFRGTGKTSLLRYTLHNVQRDPNCRIVILFKSDVEEEKRMQISKHAETILSEVDSGRMSIAQDFKSAWTWFILDAIGKRLKNNIEICERDGAYASFLRLLGLSDSNPFKKVLGFLPRLEGAKIKIGADLEFFGSHLDLEFEQEGSGAARALFSDLVSTALDALAQVKFLKELVVGIDELEVFFIEESQYKRDLSMVRDLIFVTDKLNHRIRAAEQPILLLAAIRREVVDAIGPLGQEVNRVVHDRGVDLAWHHAQRSLSHPLIEMIRKKIAANFNVRPEKDWISILFDRDIDGEALDAYLLDRSFYRPRDIMWRLTFAQKAFPKEKTFSARIFKETESLYSYQLWSEIEYELSATYSSGEIEAITSIFSGIRRLFYIRDLERIASEKSKFSRNVENFILVHSLADVCRTLYTHGALGNDFRTGSTGNISRNRWIFRGDHQPLLDQRMTLNPALRKALSAIDARKRGTRSQRSRGVRSSVS